jgi:hypothetical protein
VTAYFDGPSKSDSRHYLAWISHFLEIFVGVLYFYTTPLWQIILTNHTRVSQNVHFRLNYSGPFDIPCMRSLRSVYAKQFSLDPEYKIHKGPHLSAVWNSKICLMSEVSLLEPDSTVFWIDAGSCREEKYGRYLFPNLCRLASVITPETKGAMIFAAWQRIIFTPQPSIQLIQKDLVIGTFYGGDQAALRDYWTFFWAIHDYFLEKGKFIGKDQHLMSTYVAYADRAWIQPNYEASCNRWFSTFSFYGDTSLCFNRRPTLHPHKTYFPRQTNRSVLKEWIESIRVPFHPFAR